VARPVAGPARFPVPPLGLTLARLLKALTRLRFQPHVGRIQAALLRRSGGRWRRARILAGGQPVLALTTTGRRSGKRRSTTLAYVRHGDAYAVGALNLGSDHHPAWYLNLRADPRAEVHVDGRDVAVTARDATGEEAEHLWRAFIDRLPATANTRRIARRDVPMVVLEPASG
jgi:deazaflavin-dependent oxidoreductase (nitroreductase family)